jgi:hypothetical protein
LLCLYLQVLQFHLAALTDLRQGYKHERSNPESVVNILRKVI